MRNSSVLIAEQSPLHSIKNPLWPAGHLPHKGGEDLLHRYARIGAERMSRSQPLPLVGRGWGGVFSRPHTLCFRSAMPHSNISAKTRKRAKTLRRDLTRAEREMWDLLRDFRPRGARFRRETPIGPYIADFAWLSARIIVEVDGDSHETESGRHHDQRRDRFLREQGFIVLRFDNTDVINSADAISIQLEAELAPFLDKEPAL
ncbi:endonuclease domain-containing protein [Rhizobium lemnae]